MKTVLLFYFSLLVCTIHSVSAQMDENAIRQEVLKKNITDSLFVFGKWTEDGEDETRLKYLGKIYRKDGSVIKVMTSCWIWGYSKRATSRILIFDNKNHFLGDYYLSMTYDLPEYIENGKLVFTHSETDDCDAFVKIDFANELPEQFFLECKDGMGDIYNFEPK